MSRYRPFLGAIEEHIRLALVRETDEVEAAVRVSCPPPAECRVFALDGLLNEQRLLSEHGERIVEAATACEVLLVEWNLNHAPEINTLGFHLRRLRAAPLVALCRGTHDEWTAALAAGADFVASFPLHLPLLRAYAVSYHRLESASREAAPSDAEKDAASRPVDGRHDVHTFRELRLDRTAHRFYIRDAEIELTPREFALLEYLIEHAESALTRDQILDAVWGINFDTGTNMVDVYMYFLRRKLEAHGLSGVIQTVRGYGYRLAAPGNADG